MSAVLKAVCLVYLFFILTGCSPLIQIATSEHVDHKYFGSISFGEPVAEEGLVKVLLRFGDGPWKYNSGITVRKAVTEVVNDGIEFRIITCVASRNTVGWNKPEIVLKNVKPGTYPVFYKDPNGSRHYQGQIIIAGKEEP